MGCSGTVLTGRLFVWDEDVQESISLARVSPKPGAVNSSAGPRAEGCQSQGRCRLEPGGQGRLSSALQPRSTCSAVHRNQDSGDVLVLVDSEDDEEGKGEEESMGSSAKHETLALVNGNSLQAAQLHCLAEGEPWCWFGAGATCPAELWVFGRSLRGRGNPCVCLLAPAETLLLCALHR